MWSDEQEKKIWILSIKWQSLDMLLLYKYMIYPQLKYFNLFQI